jgi:hypothetical protein
MGDLDETPSACWGGGVFLPAGRGRYRNMRGHVHYDYIKAARPNRWLETVEGHDFHGVSKVTGSTAYDTVKRPLASRNRYSIHEDVL